MAVFAYRIEDRQGREEVFSLSDKETFLISEECLYPSFRCRIDNYGKTFLYPNHVLAIQEYLTSAMLSKEAKHSYDDQYRTLSALREKFAFPTITTGLILLGD